MTRRNFHIITSFTNLCIFFFSERNITLVYSFCCCCAFIRMFFVYINPQYLLYIQTTPWVSRKRTMIVLRTGDHSVDSVWFLTGKALHIQVSILAPLNYFFNYFILQFPLFFWVQSFVLTRSGYLARLFGLWIDVF